MTIDTANIDSIISTSLQGKGPLRSHLNKVYENFIAEEMSGFRLSHPAGTEITKEQQTEIEQNARKQLAIYANGSLKDKLTKASQGTPLTPDQGATLKEMAGMAGVVGQASASLGSGSMMGMLSIIPSMMTAFGEYITAAFSYFFPGDAPNPPKTFGEAWANVRVQKTVPEFAHFVGADPDQLMAALTIAPPPAVSPQAAQTMIALDDQFNAGTIDQINNSKDTAYTKAQEEIKKGNIKPVNNGVEVGATQDALRVLDALPPGALVEVKTGSSWAKKETPAAR